MELESLYNAYKPIVEKITRSSNGLKFIAHFLEPDPNAINAENYNEVNYIFYLGIIERCHIACLTSAFRNIKWLDGTLDSKRKGNALSFSANLRGFLESSADSWDLMQYLPKSLYLLAPFLYITMQHRDKNLNIHVNLGELERRLIHFSYARRPDKGVASLPEHTNKSNTEYIKAIQDSGVPDVANLYSLLCQLTHPAADSLNCFMEVGANSLTFNTEKEKSIIHEILNKYENSIEGLITKSINSALISLSFLSRIMPHIHAPSDREIGSIGSVNSMLKNIDAITSIIDNGTLNWDEFRRNPTKWDVLLKHEK